jgi:hypothetical protein
MEPRAVRTALAGLLLLLWAAGAWAHPYGSHLVSADSNGLVKLWDTRTRQLLRTFEKKPL